MHLFLIFFFSLISMLIFLLFQKVEDISLFFKEIDKGVHDHADNGIGQIFYLSSFVFFSTLHTLSDCGFRFRLSSMYKT